MPTYGLNIDPNAPRSTPFGGGAKPRADVYENERTREVDALGQGIQSQGQSLFGTQQNAAQGFANQATGFNPTAMSVTGRAGGASAQPGAGALGSASSPPVAQAAQRPVTSPTMNNPAATGGAALRSGIFTAPNQSTLSGAMKPSAAALGNINMGTFGQAAAPSGPPAFQTGQRATAGAMGNVGDVNTGALGGYGSVMGGLGAAPGAVDASSLGSVGNVAGRLGGGPGSAAGALGGAYQVGQVGNIGAGAAPGGIAGQLGTLGLSSADQAGMMGRLNGFLDAPEGPSVAEAQLRQAQSDNIGQMIGMARSGRGGAGAQAQALTGAMSEGGALMSDTAGQLATLRAQEEDMRKNRSLSAIGLGGEMATAARGQDLSFRGQDLSALQGDQSTALGARGQDLTASMANQSTQSQLEQLRANTATASRGQDLSALQGDQSAALGMRGQDLSALQGDQSAALGMRGQNLSAAQGNQSTALGARGQDLSGLSSDQSADIAARGQNLSALQGNQQAGITARGQNIAQEGNILGANTTMRGQDLSAVTGDADRNLAAQQLALQGKLGYGGLQNQATGQGLQYLSTANQQALGAEGLKQGTIDSEIGRQEAALGRDSQERMAAMSRQAQIQAANASGPSIWQTALPVAGMIGGAILGGPIGAGIGGAIGGGVASATAPRKIDSQNPYG